MVVMAVMMTTFAKLVVPLCHSFVLIMKVHGNMIDSIFPGLEVIDTKPTTLWEMIFDNKVVFH